MPETTRPAIRLSSLESLRGIAALMVVFYHLVELAQLPLPPQLSLVRTHFGLGVPLFYALSGFVLSYGYAEKLRLRPGAIANFFIGRFFRIAPLFFAVIIFWRGIGWLLWSWPLPSQSVVLNFTFLFGLVPGEHESLVMAGWSIGVEMLFYLVFPIFAVALRSIWSTAVFFGISLVLSAAVFNAFSAAGLGSYAYMNLATHMPFFVAGALAFQLWQASRQKGQIFGWMALLSAATLGASMLISTDLYQALFDLRFGMLHRNIWAVVFGLFIYSVCTIHVPFLENGALPWLGRISFSLYLLHPMLMVALMKMGAIAWFSSLGLWTGFSAGGIATLFSLVAASHLTYVFIETPGISLGRRLTSPAQALTPVVESTALPATDRPTADSATPSPVDLSKTSFQEKLESAIGGVKTWTLATYAGAAASFVFLSYFTFATLGQRLVDVHSFRQTQTALTSYWMLKEGWQLAYQTPVVGFPWSIPLEFPIYQALVSLAVWITGFDLVATGRFLSYLFLTACAWPIFSISGRLGLSRSTPFIWCILLWTSPLYLYWGRTFMIETAALFFSVASIPFAIDISRKENGWRSICFYLAFATLGVLQKATTAGPVLLFLFLALLGQNSGRQTVRWSAVRTLAWKLMWIVLPVLIGIAWTKYSDAVKLQNPFGAQLTSSALTKWNFGTLDQRLNFGTWKEVIWHRGFLWNGGAIIGIAALVAPWLLGSAYRRAAQLSLLALCLYALPFLIFTNLHIIHEYYQVGCTFFLISSLAIAIGSFHGSTNRKRSAALLAVVLIVLVNTWSFTRYYKIVALRPLEASDTRAIQAYKVGKFLSANTPTNSAIIVFSQTYSSEIGFNAERKSVTMPPWFKDYRNVWKNPEDYVGNLEIGAIVICPVTNNFPVHKDVDNKMASMPEWNRQSIEGCEVLLPRL